MRISFVIRSVLSSALSIGALALAWLYLAPPALHGSTNYVVIRGVSMQPRFHAGDLAVVRSGGSYRVGDIVAYRSAFLHTLILHRIVGIEGGRYLFKGDNNNFIDSERPTRSQLAGELWVRVPEAGKVFAWMGRPSHAALVAGLSALFALAGGGLGLRTRRRRAERPAVRGRRPSRGATPYTPELAGTLLALGLIAALLFGVLALVGYRHRTTMTVQQPSAYTEHGTYGYSAATQPSAIYPSGTVSTGDTVFVRLVHRLGLSFHYRFASSLPHTVAGDAQLSAALVSGAGWTRQVGIAKRRFKGDDVRLAVPLDLATLEKMIAGYYRLAGVGNDTFEVVLTPRVETHGAVGGRAVSNSFVPGPLAFTLDPDVLRAAGAATAAAGRSAATLFQRSSTGTLARTEPGTVRLLGRAAGVKTLREIGSIGGLGALLLVLFAAAVLAATRRGDELPRIQRTYGSALVAVSSPPQTADGRYVDVPTFDSLVQLAETYEKLILHHQQWGVHSFYIDDDSSVYRYTLDRSPQGREAQPTEVL